MDNSNTNSVLDAKPPGILRAVNQTAGFLRRLGLVSFNPSPEKLMQAARAKTKLEDFGEDDFQQDMREFMACFYDDDRLNFTGVAGLKGMVQNSLERRLCIQRDIARHPEILSQKIEKPLYVAGFPRSGTTLMQNLLIQHPGCRWMGGWEPMTPFPEAGVWGGERDPRVAQFRAAAEKVKKQFPMQDQIHSWDNPGECWLLLYASFVAPQLLGSLIIEPYRRWWEKLPPEAFARAYRFYRKQLQYLNWRQSGTHWVLKETSHMRHLDQLLECFPDARIVQTHRDPVECMGSACSLIYYQFRCYDSARGVTPQEVGRLLLEAYSGWAARNAALRRALPAASFCDVYYGELVKEPLNTVRRIYEHFQMEFTPELKGRVEAWLQDHHGANRPRHNYRLEEFGLTSATVNEAFKPYREYFNL